MREARKKVEGLPAGFRFHYLRAHLSRLRRVNLLHWRCRDHRPPHETVMTLTRQGIGPVPWAVSLGQRHFPWPAKPEVDHYACEEADQQDHTTCPPYLLPGSLPPLGRPAGGRRS